jgi:hypothetical protein
VALCLRWQAVLVVAGPLAWRPAPTSWPGYGPWAATATRSSAMARRSIYTPQKRKTAGSGSKHFGFVRMTLAPAGLGRGTSRAAPAGRDADAVVGGVWRRDVGRLQLFVVLREAPPPPEEPRPGRVSWVANGENMLLLGPPEPASQCSPFYLIRVPALFVADCRAADVWVSDLDIWCPRRFEGLRRHNLA